MSIVVGLQKIHIAKLTKDDVTGVTYASTPTKLANAIEAKISPSISSETLYADDGPSAVASSLGEIEVEINIDALSTQAVIDILGITKNADGVLEYTSNINPPYLALGFMSPLSNGGARYVWLTKGKFEIPEENYKTKGDKLEFQTPTLKAKFVKREYDGMWKYQVDSTDSGIDLTVIPNWFNAVYAPTA